MFFQDRNIKTSFVAASLSAICVAPFFIYSIQSACSSWISYSVLILPLMVAALSYNQGRKGKMELMALYQRIDRNVKSFLFNSGEVKTTDVLGELDRNLKEATHFIRNIGEGNFNVGYGGMNDALLTLNQDTLSGELVQMKKKMMQVAEKEKQQAWVTNGIAHFAEIVRTQQEGNETIFSHFISELIRYMGANQGGIFIANDQDHDRIVLELKGCYAYGRRKFIEQSIAIGEGLVGQAFQEGDVIYLTDVPKNYMSITSGLGEATPRCVILMPMKNNHSIEGVIEVASFRVWESFETEFLRRVAEILGSAVTSMKIAQRTNRLLDDSQQQSEQLKAQEEELRQNIEEINATQETLERKSREAQLQNNKLNAILDATVDGILTFDERGRIETINRAGLELFGYEEQGVIGKNIDTVLPETSSHPWSKNSSVNTAKAVSYQTKALKSDGTFFHVEVVMNRTELEGRKIVTGIVRDISERINAENEQQQYIEELRAQEEELKQNMEELQATQDEIHRQMEETRLANRELDARIAALNTSTIMSESDLYGNILFINDKFCEVSQFNRDELIGKPHKIVRHPDMPSEVFKLMWKTIKAGKVFRGIVKNRKKDGSHYWVDAVISPVLNEKGVPVKYIGVRYVIEDEEQAQKLFLHQLMELNIGRTASISEINKEDTQAVIPSAKKNAMVG
jgi:PAS domain S-box-containing protein